MKKTNNAFAVVLMTAILAFALTGCDKLMTVMQNLTDAERAQNIVDAYVAGDAETFNSYVEHDSRMVYMMNGVAATNPEAMQKVYQKIHELTKTAEITFTDDSYTDDGYATATIKTVDFTNALNEAMGNAIAEGGDVFADMPGWMMEALNTGGESVELEVKIRTGSNNDLHESHSEEFMQALTGGFYNCIMWEMTTCKMDDDGSQNMYLISNYDAIKISLDEYFLSDEGVEITEEEANKILAQFNHEYADLDGLVSGGQKVEGGMRLYLIVNYDMASSYTLQRLGLTSGGYADYISLSSTISGFVDDGYTCATTDFGSGVMEQKAEEFTEK